MTLPSIAEFRKVLGEAAAGKTDAEVAAMREDHYRFAALLVAGWTAVTRREGIRAPE